MFEDTQQPEDMFDATDKVAPQVAPPTQVSSAESVVTSLPEGPSELGSVAQISERRGGFPWKVILLVIGIFVVIGAAFLLSMKILGSKTSVTPEPPGEVSGEDESSSSGDETQEEEEVEEVVEEEADEEKEVSRKDTDKDGLTDEEEEEYGTSTSTADTDSDGLFDPEEIKTWETDPLNSDTDGDGYLDGEEVDAGYNPSGDGLLREAPTESS